MQSKCMPDWTCRLVGNLIKICAYFVCGESKLALVLCVWVVCVCSMWTATHSNIWWKMCLFQLVPIILHSNPFARLRTCAISFHTYHATAKLHTIIVASGNLVNVRLNKSSTAIPANIIRSFRMRNEFIGFHLFSVLFNRLCIWNAIDIDWVFEIESATIVSSLMQRKANEWKREKELFESE